jgi:hypothetical protein
VKSCSGPDGLAESAYPVAGELFLRGQRLHHRVREAVLLALRVELAGHRRSFDGETHEMLESTGRGADRVPVVGRAVEAMDAYRDAARAVLMKGRAERGRARIRVAAAIGHALAFPTLRSLVQREGLAAEEAVGQLTGLVASAGRR